MANKNRFIRNINAAAESRYSKAAVRGIENTGKWMATDHIGSSHLASMMEFQQSMNYSNASHNLLMRRLDRFNQSSYQRILGWIADYTHYAWDMLLGFLNPIISMIFWSVFRIIVIIVFNIIFFYTLFSLLTL